MATDIIADTSGLVAYFIASESNHAAARRYMQTHSDRRWVILESVFDETVTWLRAKVSTRDSIRLGLILRENHRYANLSDADDAATWDVFRKYDDKEWSYTDCSILAISQRLGIAEVFTFDHHIRQMSALGIVPVP